MRDLSSSAWIKVKAALFLLLGLVCWTLLFVDRPTLRFGVLLCLTIWCFCRFYYFAFYVIEHYVDSSYKFSGLISFCRYLIKKDSV